ncbi:leucine-rich repeat domain-containing protein [Corallococcus llansteffanensis]|uniref:Leucine-rich repeat domain-containing protein n=1 Tax=Corallococcus llansteffanensis TaxID=2316731 RepID=A0A3A8NXQ3_9BACT|nr:leucine-rich repeat domain-containing protein [Corallococcus llansteffanensis]
MLALMGSGCEAINVPKITQRDALTRFRPEPSGEHCDFGGQAVLTGLDQDHNGVLDDVEVLSTQYVCADAVPTVRTRTQVEPPGAHCFHGGQAVHSGLDSDGNGHLDDPEVSSTEYVCATTVPHILMTSQPVAPRATCPRGGMVTRVGHDANGNGLLDDEEVAREVEVCNEPIPVLSRVRRLADTSPKCVRGGSVVQAGMDLDLDGFLDLPEVNATAYACDVEPADLHLKQGQVELGSGDCAARGTRVDAFEDLDGDTLPDPGGYTTTLYVCEATRTYDGDFVVSNDVDLFALEGVDRLRGDLRIQAPELGEVILPTLAIIDGSLVVQGNSSLKWLDLGMLRFIGDDAEIRDNAQLEEMALGDEEHPLLVAGSLTVEKNPKFSSLKSLVAVVPTDSITVRANDTLESPGVMPHVVTLTGSLTLQDNPLLTGTPFVNLLRVDGDLRLVNNPGMEGPFGLEQLQSVGGTLELRDNPQLETLAPLGHLASVGSLELSGNLQLPDTSGLLNLTRAGRIHVQGNAAMVSLGDMPLLTSVDEEFFVKHNPSLQRVHGLPLLRTAGTVSVVGNEALTSLSGLARLPQLGTLEVLANAKLPTLGDFAKLRELEFFNVQGNTALTGLGLGELARVTQTFIVSDNTKLPTCQATALAASVFQGTPSIDRNDDAGTCP